MATRKIRASEHHPRETKSRTKCGKEISPLELLAQELGKLVGQQHGQQLLMDQKEDRCRLTMNDNPFHP
jgi:hypothetical protein